ncbi:MAG: hypothetical protein EKK53_05475 [Burkholderiales bacterium]|nr:MAG: hypothetical protein EKK53_05475 [Burkholderiales bacterium]
MKPLWIAGLAGLTVIVAVLVLQPTPPAAVPPSSPAAAALPLALPPASGVSAAPAPATSRAASTVLSVAAPVAPAVGPEGYGPHIDRAHAGSDPQAAWDAVLWLRRCSNSENRRRTAEDLRNQGIAPEFMTQRIVEIDAEARRCQTVTDAHRALLAPLAMRAMRAGVPEAASAYAEAVFPADLTPTQRSEVAEALRRDALSGRDLALLSAAVANPGWGLTDEERLTFLFALTQFRKPMMTPEAALTMIQTGQVPQKSLPTAAQVTSALQASRQLVAKIEATPRP